MKGLVAITLVSLSGQSFLQTGGLGNVRLLCLGEGVGADEVVRGPC
jgi:hypothetical protein